MNENLLKTLANENISSDSGDRIPQMVKDLLQKSDTIIDSHCHIFDKSCVPVPYLHLRLHMANKKRGFNAESFLSGFGSNMNIPGTDIEDFIEIFKMKNMRQVLKFLFQNYYNPQSTILTPLMMDLEAGWNSKPQKSVRRQISELKKLIDEFAILPFFAVDPRKKDIYDNFIYSFSKPNSFFGIKVYPALGYLPSDPVLMPLYEICESKKIPVTTHCGGDLVGATQPTAYSGFRVVDNNLEFYSGETTGKYAENASFYNNPQLWEPVLFKHPKLKLNLAHFAGTDEWNRFHKGDEPERINTIIRLMKNYENVYADFSFNIHKNNMANILSEKLEQDKLVRERVLWGTDFHVVLPASNLKRDIDRYEKKIWWNQISRINPERFLFS
ncbi:MAG: amidohydrolase family protein [Bacteroidales bacterium]|nr:amidohydrolase family protein [Bacteroidales bacterium]MBN2819954.1 amidohydrolase family protein [Bacteroidales bacterium]